MTKNRRLRNYQSLRLPLLRRRCAFIFLALTCALILLCQSAAWGQKKQSSPERTTKAATVRAVPDEIMLRIMRDRKAQNVEVALPDPRQRERERRQAQRDGREA